MSTPDNRDAYARPAVDNDPVELAEWYRSQFGWHVRLDGDIVHLRLDHGMMAFLVPFSRVTEVFWARRRLDLLGPVLLVRGAASHVVLLADSNDVVLSQQDLPAGTGLLRAPSWLQLPSDGQGSAATRWLEEPRSTTRWLPSATAVLRAVIMATSVERTIGVPSRQASVIHRDNRAHEAVAESGETLRRRIA
ncbi:MAG TPA: hypothetical protein VHX38_40015 [Pseudonocardiaceae bacterium]|jgi:hypothetical protein|nr:hypothetical protein [Pseudonocardiaceae bacterium]